MRRKLVGLLNWADLRFGAAATEDWGAFGGDLDAGFPLHFST